ncbi:S-adenosyl-L-methionine-dependent methyltransferase [Aspergillus karnatakaensis]|uniref:class I SAM-dependent methyltransferase n=1 Tax=Aspergillus karnatakaensis TaxID=1810916 RepID=UPI003CCD5846
MATQYDALGAEYNTVEQLPIRTLELAAVRAHVGDVHGLEVLDLACGTGRYTRKLIEWGAKTVVGVDISQAMVDEARRECARACEGRVDFRVTDCAKPGLDVGKFDLVLASWFLDYARNEEEMFNMWTNIARSLKPGGRCVGITVNLGMLETGLPSKPTFGISLKQLERVVGGLKLDVRVHSFPEFSFESYMLERGICERSAQRAGIRDLEWMPPVDPEDPSIEFPRFVEYPHFWAFTCRGGGAWDDV